jgi:hypothetical protein
MTRQNWRDHMGLALSVNLVNGLFANGGRDALFIIKTF